MLSKKTRYAMLALAKLTREYGNGPVLIGDIAKEEKIPQRFLESILLDLKNYGILGSKMGKSGGYFLMKDPGSINLSEIVRHFDGAIALIPCASEKYYQACEFCKNEKTCKIRKVFKKIRDNTYNMLSNTSLSDLV
jgi:Rrf2 family protein